jgi:hypothetical protein
MRTPPLKERSRALLQEVYNIGGIEGSKGINPNLNLDAFNDILMEAFAETIERVINENEKIPKNTNTANKIHFQARNELREQQRARAKELGL